MTGAAKASGVAWRGFSHSVATSIGRSRVYATNVYAPLHLIQHALPLLLRVQGTIVNVSSDAAVAAHDLWIVALPRGGVVTFLASEVDLGIWVDMS